MTMNSISSISALETVSTVETHNTATTVMSGTLHENNTPLSEQNSPQANALVCSASSSSEEVSSEEDASSCTRVTFRPKIPSPKKDCVFSESSDDFDDSDDPGFVVFKPSKSVVGGGCKNVQTNGLSSSECSTEPVSPIRTETHDTETLASSRSSKGCCEESSHDENGAVNMGIHDNKRTETSSLDEDNTVPDGSRCVKLELAVEDITEVPTQPSPDPKKAETLHIKEESKRLPLYGSSNGIIHSKGIEEDAQQVDTIETKTPQNVWSDCSSNLPNETEDIEHKTDPCGVDKPTKLISNDLGNSEFPLKEDIITERETPIEIENSNGVVNIMKDELVVPETQEENKSGLCMASDISPEISKSSNEVSMLEEKGSIQTVHTESNISEMAVNEEDSGELEGIVGASVEIPHEINSMESDFTKGKNEKNEHIQQIQDEPMETDEKEEASHMNERSNEPKMESLRNTNTITDKSPIICNGIQTADESVCREMDPVPEKASVDVKQERCDSDDEDYLVMQPEVVMSESSDSDSENAHTTVIQETIEQYASSMLKAHSEGRLVTHPQVKRKLHGKVDLNSWQLDHVALPQYRPKIEPPSWLRLTIPPEGYKCLSCGDIFFLETSLNQHKQRQSVLISYDCSFCEVKLYFFNKCSFRDHLRLHRQKGEVVEEKGAQVKPLPLQMMQLMEPLVIPAPAQLQARPTKKVSMAFTSDSVKSPTPPTPKCNESSIKNHKASHSAPEENKTKEGVIGVPCCLCKEKFTSIRGLMQHMRTIEDYSDEQVECEQCPLVLPSVCAAKAHVFIHAPPSERTVCPECGSKCDGAREFVRHLNLCGHQYRTSGYLCFECKVSFLRNEQSFLKHWLQMHCSRGSQCTTCHTKDENKPCPHGTHTLVETYKCSKCTFTAASKGPLDTWQQHMIKSHSWVFKSIAYVYKSKFCTNAFRNKNEFLLHHQKEHRSGESGHVYQMADCSLSDQVLKLQQSFCGDQKNVYITLSVPLEPQQQAEADKRLIPTVAPLPVEASYHSASRQSAAPKCHTPKINYKLPKGADSATLERLRPTICFKCGDNYGCRTYKEHSIKCTGYVRERVCLVCRAMATGPGFVDHCLEHIQEGMLLCMYCNGRDFSCSSDLANHFFQHANEQFTYPMECIFCSQTLVSSQKAFHHIKIKHHTEFVRTANNKCKTCNRMFHGGRGLVLHQYKCQPKSTASSVQVRICNFCKKCVSNENMAKHLSQHLEEGALICCLCEGSFLYTRSKLLDHLKGHATSLAYPKQCIRTSCTAELKDERDALHHFKQEHGFEQAHCNKCDKSFSFFHILQRHLEIAHSKSKFAKRRYVCWICQAFEHAKKRFLYKHMEAAHHLKSEDIDEESCIRKRCPNQFASPIASRYVKKMDKGSCDSDDSDPSKPCDKQKNTLPYQKAQESLIPLKMPSDNLSIVYPKHFLSNMKNYEGFKSPAKDSEEDHCTKESPSSKVKRNFVKTRVDSKLSNGTTTHVLLPKLDPGTFLPGSSKKKPLPRTAGTKGDSSNKKELPSKKANSVEAPAKLDNSIEDKKRLIQENGVVSEKRLKKNPPDEPVSKRETTDQTNPPKEMDASKSTPTHEECDMPSNEPGDATEGFPCDACNLIFVTQTSLVSHKFFVHRMNPKKRQPSITCQKKQFLKSLNLEQSSLKARRQSQGTRQKMTDKSTKKPTPVDNSAKISMNPKKRRKTVQLEHQGAERDESPAAKKTRLSLDSCVASKKESQCSVCKEQFDSPAAMHRHLKVHGMAFLKLGTKKRGII